MLMWRSWRRRRRQLAGPVGEVQCVYVLGLEAGATQQLGCSARCFFVVSQVAAQETETTGGSLCLCGGTCLLAACAVA